MNGGYGVMVQQLVHRNGRRICKRIVSVVFIFIGFFAGLTFISYVTGSHNNIHSVSEQEGIELRSKEGINFLDLRHHGIMDKTINKSKPLYLLVLAYQRTGSTFLGSMFNSHPDVFYMYEPLDALYSHIFGTRQGWNVPSDIFNDVNGTLREISEDEIQFTNQFMINLFSCDMPSIPISFFTHHYYDIIRDLCSFSKGFCSCRRKYLNKSKASVNRCMTLRSSYCGAKFGEVSKEKQHECKNAWTKYFNESYHHENFLLKKSIELKVIRSISMRNSSNISQFTEKKQFKQNINVFSTNTADKQILEYAQCSSKLAVDFPKDCLNIFENSCVERKFRVMKTVRASMHNVKELLKLMPDNFKVVHLLRDPRAVSLSRKNFDSSGQGLYALNATHYHIAREAKLYCNAVKRDLLMRKELNELYPGRIYELRYDDLVNDLEGQMIRLHNFIGLPITTSVVNWYSANSKKYDIEKWKRDLTVKENEEILENCVELFNITSWSL